MTLYRPVPDFIGTHTAVVAATPMAVPVYVSRGDPEAAALIRAERLRRKAENFAKRQPKKDSPK
jgi:hypothetical protein